jgi:hypothetical protein
MDSTSSKYGSGIRIRDGAMVGSRSGIKHPGSATLGTGQEYNLKNMYIIFCHSTYLSCKDINNKVAPVIPANSACQFQAFNTKAAIVKAGLVSLFRNCHIQMELFQRPGVGLNNRVGRYWN